MNQLARLDAHHRLLIGFGVAALTFTIASRYVIWPLQLLITYDSYALTVNALAWLSMTYLHPLEALKAYKLQDSGRVLILIFAITAAMASFFAVIFLLDVVKQLNGHHLRLYIILSAITVINSWVLLHSLFTLRYAHLYYRQEPGEGLNFPDTKQPVYEDFAYVAFGIGMTSQVADVGPTNSAFRRLILVHSLLSFAFNTLIVALSINVVSGVLS
ncbi:DUF1345 domain-containing protein [Fibrella sp. WM1]|uniref:DUF1345 domain-containing protein n=1 Tax=Fibrella musci TaxID=3242485 RepID=UPI0035230B99